MSVCVCVCVSVCVHVCMCVEGNYCNVLEVVSLVSSSVLLYLGRWVCVYSDVCMYACVYKYINACVYAWVCEWTHTCAKHKYSALFAYEIL